VGSSKTDEKLQKIVDEYFSVKKSVVSSAQQMMTSGPKGEGQGFVCSGGRAQFLCGGSMMIVFIVALCLACTACSMRTCSFSNWPALPSRIGGYFDPYVFGCVSLWIITQAIFSALPLSKLKHTGKGLTHSYRSNGAVSLLLTGAILAAAYGYKLPVFETLSKNFLPVTVSFFIVSLLISVWMYVRARGLSADKLSPFGQTGNMLVDFVVGRETNPTFLRYVDIKSLLVVNIACIGWAVMDTVVVMEAYHRDRLDVAMVTVAACHAVFICDFVIFENCLSTSLLMTHDGVGLRLSLLSLIFAPFINNVHLRYLLLHPSSQWSHPAIAIIAVLFITGYITYRGSNFEKHSFRKNPHHPSFSGLDVIPSPSGKPLLCSGTWWGYLRRPNYLGQIIMTIAWSIPCGLVCPLTFLYPVFITIGLMSRVRRDELFCRQKHGQAWDRYTQQVRSRLIPFLY